MNAIRLFTGFDKREAVGWHVFAQSVIEKTPEPVSIVPLSAGGRDGSNTFTYSRFLVPYLCDFQGWAIWADGADMLLTADLTELWAFRQGWYAVQVVKHEYATKHPRKYRGTEMESANHDYPRKNWSSLILWDCGHYMNRVLTPDFVASHDGAFLHRFGWLQDDRIGELPMEWNWLADEYGVSATAKLIHFTAGIPAIEAHASAAMSGLWWETQAHINEVPAAVRIAEIASAR